MCAVQRPSLSIEERIKQPIQQADIIDLLSSDEEGEDEAATLHGEISPVSLANAPLPFNLPAFHFQHEKFLF